MRAVEFLGGVVWLTEQQYEDLRNVPGNDLIRDATDAQVRIQIAREAAERWETRIAMAIAARG